ncbi:hypothetical protein MESS4_30002 [Mesorhizobium sp. STM 4661]|nr:hypothetical protein MESS4_30002 [Mesorhizobium sp. STM 4661]
MWSALRCTSINGCHTKTWCCNSQTISGSDCDFRWSVRVLTCRSMRMKLNRFRLVLTFVDNTNNDALVRWHYRLGYALLSVVNVRFRDCLLPKKMGAMRQDVPHIQQGFQKCLPLVLSFGGFSHCFTGYLASRK